MKRVRRDRLRRTYSWLLENDVGPAKLAQWANQHGLTIYGRPVTSHSTVAALLLNPAYMGSFGWNRHAKGRFYTLREGKAVELPLPEGGRRKDRNVFRPREEWVLRPGVWPDPSVGFRAHHRQMIGCHPAQPRTILYDNTKIVAKEILELA